MDDNNLFTQMTAGELGQTEALTGVGAAMAEFILGSDDVFRAFIASGSDGNQTDEELAELRGGLDNIRGTFAAMAEIAERQLILAQLSELFSPAS